MKLLFINFLNKLCRYETDEVGCPALASWDVFSRFLVVFAEIYWANTGLFGRRVIRTNCSLPALVRAQYQSVRFNSKLQTDKVWTYFNHMYNVCDSWYYGMAWQSWLSWKHWNIKAQNYLSLETYPRPCNRSKTTWFYDEGMVKSFKIIKIQKLCGNRFPAYFIYEPNFVPLKFYNFILIYCTKIFKQ